MRRQSDVKLCGLSADLQVLVLAGSSKLVRVIIVFKCILTALVEDILFAPVKNSEEGKLEGVGGEVKMEVSVSMGAFVF